MKRSIVVVLALALVGALGISLVSAYGGFGKGMGLSEEDRDARMQQQEVIREAVETGDYELWATAMQERVDEMQAYITEDNFNILQERHTQMSELRTAMQEARTTGDWSEVEALQEAYGLDKGMKGKGHGNGRAFHEMKFGHRYAE